METMIVPSRPWKLIESAMEDVFREISDDLRDAGFTVIDDPSLVVEKLGANPFFAEGVSRALDMAGYDVTEEALNDLICGLTGTHPNGSNAEEGGYWPPEIEDEEGGFEYNPDPDAPENQLN